MELLNIYVLSELRLIPTSVDVFKLRKPYLDRIPTKDIFPGKSITGNGQMKTDRIGYTI